MNKWRVMATKIFGVQLFAVETDGYILKYCDTRKEAVDFITTISV